jgi:hemoglobin
MVSEQIRTDVAAESPCYDEGGSGRVACSRQLARFEVSLFWSHGALGKTFIAMTRAETLYERLGGDSGIAGLIVRFYARVLSDQHLAPFFQNTSLEKLMQMQREFFGAALDGPQTYSGQALSRAHVGRGITSEDFNRFSQHLTATLQESGVNEDDLREVIHRIAVHKNDITGEAY